MATTQKKPPYKLKTEPVLQTRDSIEAQTAAFLEAGGRIQRIATGVSGRGDAIDTRPAPAKKAAPAKAAK